MFSKQNSLPVQQKIQSQAALQHALLTEMIEASDTGSLTLHSFSFFYISFILCRKFGSPYQGTRQLQAQHYPFRAVCQNSKFESCKNTTTSAAILFPAVWISDVMDKARMCSESIKYVPIQLFHFFFVVHNS